MTITAPHGFVWPSGLPACTQCGRDANASIHVNPARPSNQYLLGLQPRRAADTSTPNLPDRAHAYSASNPMLQNVQCTVCNQTMAGGPHPTGMGGYLMAQTMGRDPQAAFVAETGGRIVMATRADAADTVAGLPAEVAANFQERSGSRSANLWIAGRYVQAERANRNAAFWSTADLEMGAPSVSHGPINWLHEDRHVIGCIADSQPVFGQREAADDIGNHIVALGAVWPYLYPQESRVIRAASDSGKLYFSMECISRSVACLDEGCGKEMPYRDYVTQKASRCDHMAAGRPRRFVDPVFLGAGIIVPPVSPGWSRADAKVLMPQAAQLVDKQAAAFGQLSQADAETLVASLIR